MLSSGDEAFERAKAQALCVMYDLDVSKMYFFKTVVEDHLVDMEEASPEEEVLNYVVIKNSTHEAREDEYHDV